MDSGSITAYGVDAVGLLSSALQLLRMSHGRGQQAISALSVAPSEVESPFFFAVAFKAF